ncbi:MAG: cell division protein FtsA [Thermales bacterium]|nr:cell division protein FtsA [Thermales bacterium]
MVERNSKGIRKGIVTNMSEATEALIDIINKAEGIIGLPIRRAVVGISGLGVTFTNSEGLIVISRTDNEISDSDVDRVIQDSLTKAFGLNNNEIIHVIPKSYTIDNQSGIRYPVGMVGSKLETKTLMVSVETSYLRNFTKVFNQGSLEITSQYYTPLASSSFILTERQKKAGTVLVDIGYSTTSYIVWENEEIFNSGIIPIGSDHITADLAVGLQTTIELAEEIKKQHLNLDPDSDNQDEEVEIFNPDLQINETFKSSEIVDYAKARTEEIFIYLNKELRKLGKNAQLPGGAILIGGGASLKGIEEVAKKTLKLPIFKYSFDRSMVEFVPDYNNDPTFINAISLAAYSIYYSDDLTLNNSSLKANTTRSGGSGEEKASFGDILKNLLPWK